MEGLGAFREALDEKLALTAMVCDAVVSHDALELVTEPQLSTVAFKLKSTQSLESNNEQTRTMLEAINAPGKVFLTGTTLRGEFVIRVCILSFRTHREHAQRAIDAIYRAASELESAH
jgi:aromatic-L-amino-acid decarboxylase